LGAVDTAIILKKRDQGSTFRTIQRYGNDIDEIVITLNEDHSLTVAGSLEETKRKEVWEQIKTILQSNPGATESEITVGLELHRPTVLKTIHWAVEQDLCKKEGQGKKGDPYKYFLFNAFNTYISEQKEQDFNNDIRQGNNMNKLCSANSEKIIQKQNLGEQNFNEILSDNDLFSEGGEASVIDLNGVEFEMI